jgi:parallel beta-helix repeat protein
MGAAAGPARGAQCGGEVLCLCGDVVSGEYRLPADLGPCPADGLVLRGGAVLDCQGHTIRGAGDQGEGGADVPGVGIVLDSTHEATVRGCTVTGFHTGIEFREANRNTLLGSTVFRNGDFRKRTGYGIHFSRSGENTVRDCTVHTSADEGIHVGRGSHDNTLVENSLYDNGRENLYVLDARGTRLLRNRVRGKVSAALYMKHATASHVEANQFEDRPVVILGRSSGNVFIDNRFGAGLKLEAYGGKADSAAPTGNVVRGGQLAGRGSCLSFVDASGNRIETVALSECQRITAFSERPTMNDFIDISLEHIPLDLAGGATLGLLSRVQVQVLDGRGAPVPGVQIELRDRTGQASEGPRTDGTGTVELMVPTHVMSAGSLVVLTPVELRLQADGYAVLKTQLGDPLPPRLGLTLEPAR